MYYIMEHVSITIYPISRSVHSMPLLARGPHGAHVVHQLLVLHEAAAAEVTCPGAPGDPRGGGGGPGAQQPARAS